MKAKEWFKLFFSGAAMGVANSIPGVSGGTIAVILKIYEKLIDAISNIFKKFIKSFLILLPILLGIIVAMVPCFILLKKAFEFFQFGIVSLFAGLIIGSFPSITDEVKDERISAKHIVICVISAFVAITLGVLSIILGKNFSVQDLVTNPPVWFYLVLVLAGFLASTALVVPGISGSMILVILGLYKPLVDTIYNLMKNLSSMNQSWFWVNILELGCVAIGVIIGFFITGKIMGSLLKKHRTMTFYSIIGFVAGSLVALYLNNSIWEYYEVWSEPNHLPIWLEIVLGIILLAMGLVGSYMLVRYARKKRQKDENNEECISNNEESAE